MSDTAATLQFLGAADTVTGSRYLVTAQQRRILVDCGLFQGYKVLRERNRAQFPIDPSSIDSVVVSHAHLDHSGYLPALVRDGFAGPIHVTHGTAELLGLLLLDSAHLLEEEAKFAARHGFSRHEHPQALYTVEDAERALERIVPVDFDHTVELGPELTATLVPAGHILGAAQVRIAHAGRTVHFSGDLGRTDDPLMRAPRALEPTDIVVCESTYGDRAHPAADPADELASVISRVASRGGVVIIPAFAVGRTQELLLHLARLRRAGRIPEVPVYLNSPMAKDATSLYRSHREENRISDGDFEDMYNLATIVTSVDDSKLLNLRGGPMIIISASGMLTGGRVLHHVVAYGDEPANAIVLSGFQAGGTRGAALAAGADHLRIFGKDVPIRAEVVQLQTMSAHADADGVLAWLGAVPTPPEMIYVTHGEPASADTLRARIRHELGWNARVPEQSETVQI